MNTKANQSTNIDVDTSKFQLDIYLRPLDIHFTVKNDEQGIRNAIQKIKSYKPERMPFILACSQASLPFVIANPIHVKRFAGAIGQRAKTDKLDAKQIEHYGAAIKSPLSSATCLNSVT